MPAQNCPQNETEDHNEKSDAVLLSQKHRIALLLLERSECRISETVHQCVDADTRLAQGAFAGVVAGVIGQAGRVEDGGHRDAEARGNRGEDGRQAGNGAADPVGGFVHVKAGQCGQVKLSVCTDSNGTLILSISVDR